MCLRQTPPRFRMISHRRKLEHDICCWIGAKRSWRRWWNWVALCNPWPRSPRFLSKFLFLEVSFYFFSPLLPRVFFCWLGEKFFLWESFLRLAVEKGDASSDFGSLVFVGFQATSENLAKISRTLEVGCWERWLSCWDRPSICEWDGLFTCLNQGMMILYGLWLFQWFFKGKSIARHSPSSRSCPWQAAEAQASEVMEEKSGLAIETSKWKW